MVYARVFLDNINNNCYVIRLIASSGVKKNIFISDIKIIAKLLFSKKSKT